MNACIQVYPEADAEIDECFYYLQEETDLEAAFRFVDAARETFEQLLLTPQVGATRTFQKPELQDVRMWRVKDFSKYLIFYRPVENGIEILHVVHSSRNYKRLFEEES